MSPGAYTLSPTHTYACTHAHSRALTSTYTIFSLARARTHMHARTQMILGIIVDAFKGLREDREERARQVSPLRPIVAHYSKRSHHT